MEFVSADRGEKSIWKSLATVALASAVVGAQAQASESHPQTKVGQVAPLQTLAETDQQLAALTLMDVNHHAHGAHVPVSHAGSAPLREASLEFDTYALMLAGLAASGFAIRRRKS